jgi:hypothetical protein
VWKILQLRQEYSNDEDILITHTKFSNYFKRQEYIEDILMPDILMPDILMPDILISGIYCSLNWKLPYGWGEAGMVRLRPGVNLMADRASCQD